MLKRRYGSNVQFAKDIGLVIFYTVLIAGAVTMILPFIYMLSTSLKPMAMLFTYPPEIFPKDMTFANYINVWKEFGIANYFLNSIIVSVPAVLLNVFLSSLTAYGFAKFDFPGKELFFTILIATLAVPGLLLIIPQFDMISKVRFLMNNRFTLILTGGIGGIAFNAFFLRGFFEGIVKDIMDAAEIDGCNQFQIYYKIILPQSLPALGTLAIFSFQGIWDDYFWPSLILSSQSKWTLPLGILGFQAQHGSQWNLVFAGTVIAMIPIIAVYLVFQKYFVQTVAQGGLKM